MGYALCYEDGIKPTPGPSLSESGAILRMLGKGRGERGGFGLNCAGDDLLGLREQRRIDHRARSARILLELLGP